ncbi:thioredoxin domain-containing protein [Desertihabitans brevis]|uniref:Thioredoxin domain-containing protein n=1 Tax=Desertihabitans brevis TaxID=2268447 RepID=A0A367YZY1_9ACTN|nr:thioredoxin domain-containing protein [Desertihabitans brevis]
MVNRLSDATSPYLLQHADNPVHWWPWGPEAFAEARRRDVPVFLSIGYAACHWCHVMAHESFEDEATAAVLNEGFVAVKVDREERPDVDAVYMSATTALTGQGGWPMSVFLTPDGLPFHAGTYFPPRPVHGMPSFTQLLDAVTEAWRDRREEVVQSAGSISSQLAQIASPRLPGAVGEPELEQALQRLAGEFDAERGGFGPAPKFPPSMVLEALLRAGDERSLAMVADTCRAMALGGMYDQLGGGFARYSVDADWVVPHFEKMLYDNALLLGAYTHWWCRSGDPLAARVVAETVAWLERELRTPQGAFASSLDADSPDDGVLGTPGRSREGAYYVWTPERLRQVLGEEDADWVAELTSVTRAGTFEDGTSTLQLRGDVALERWTPLRERLREARDGRPRPGRDDKVVAAWNGWLVASLVDAAGVFDRPEWLDLAREALTHVWQVHHVDGRLRRTSRDGRVGDSDAVLEDVAALVLAAVRLAAADADGRWLERATVLAEHLVGAFGDGEGGFFDTADDGEQLYLRPRDSTDNATPSGLSTTVHALAELSALSGDPRWDEVAERAAAGAGGLVPRAPRFAGWLLADAVTRLRRPRVEVAVVGEPGDPRVAQLARTARVQAPAGSVVVAGRPDAPGMPLLADRPLVDGRPAAYVCRGFVCRLPVTDVEALSAELAAV